MQSFWKDIQTPILALAPMEDVTDTVFREIILSVSNPDFLAHVNRVGVVFYQQESQAPEKKT